MAAAVFIAGQLRGDVLYRGLSFIADQREWKQPQKLPGAVEAGSSG